MSTVTQTQTQTRPPQALRNQIISYLIPALVVAALLLTIIRVQANVESAAANVSTTLPFVFAFLAGMVASVNPCGFVMLPTYISYHLGNEEEGFYERSLVERFGRGLLLGVTATGGFGSTPNRRGCWSFTTACSSRRERS